MSEPATPVGESASSVSVEEFKELGHEIRYREGFVVAAIFGAFTGVGAILNVLAQADDGPDLIVLTFVGAALAVLCLLIRHTRSDLAAARSRKDLLATQLQFRVVHGRSQGRRQISSFLLIEGLLWVGTLLWIGWLFSVSVHAIVGTTPA